MNMSLHERLRLAITNGARSNDNPTAARHYKDDEDQLTRVLALVDAVSTVAEYAPHRTDLSRVYGWEEVSTALADLRKHGDIPAETGT